MKNSDICKGKGIAKGFGCGNLYTAYSSLRKGLCDSCWPKFLFSTKEGKRIIQRSTIRATKQVLIESKKETREKKIDLLSTDGYRKKYVQPIINEIARLIDYGQPCIATGNYQGKMAGGHFISVGANRTPCLNLHNIHNQSFHSNGPKGGDNLRYREGIKKIYGQEYLDKIEALNLTPALHLSKVDLEEIKVKAEKIRNELKKNLIVRTPNERIKLREEINEQLGIYKK